VASPTPANNYEIVGLFLTENGYSAVGAAGVCGCIAGESQGDPEALEVPSDPESGGAGLIQWTPASSMEQFGGTCAAAGIGNNSVAVDMQNQMAAILGYNNAQGSSNVAALNAQPDPVTAADFYSQVFERPRVKDSDVRPAVAQSVFAFLTGTPTSTSPVPGQEYTIQSGDTFSKIATAAYGAANTDAGVTAIEQANPSADPNDLQIGQEIFIPVLDTPTLILAAHNSYRAAVATVSPLPPLQWSESLAASAQSWANHLATIGTLQEPGVGGVNLADGTAGAFSVTQLVGIWGNEQEFFENGIFPNVSSTGNWEDVGHYSQLVWRNTTEVGGALATGEGLDFLVCYYNPAGNVIGETVY
jgi:uncharacterized protein YkwD